MITNENWQCIRHNYQYSYKYNISNKDTVLTLNGINKVTTI